MTVRVLHFSPGTATDRHDSHRAALGFVQGVVSAAAELALDAVCRLDWALPAIDEAPRVHALLEGADLVAIATPVHGQGSPWFVRKFLEQTRGLQLWGMPATAFATSGGTHTGGEMALLDTFRSLQGCGACTFTFAQKLTVLPVQQRLRPDGEFDPVDVWFLRQLARTCLVQWAARSDRAAGRSVARRLGVDTAYYLDFPDAARLEAEAGALCRWMNEPLSDPAGAYGRWSHRLGFDARPPEPQGLPFAGLFPAPQSARHQGGGANWGS